MIDESLTPGPSIKPVLLVAAMLLAAILGAATTIPPTRTPAHRVPTVDIVRPHLTADKPQWV
jgi:hypothetical protein